MWLTLNLFSVQFSSGFSGILRLSTLGMSPHKPLQESSVFRRLLGGLGAARRVQGARWRLLVEVLGRRAPTLPRALLALAFPAWSVQLTLQLA